MKEHPTAIYSNISYIIVGILGLYLTPGYPGIIFFIGFCLLGIGSTLYHGKIVPWGQSADEVCMYLAYSSLISGQWSVMFSTQVPSITILFVFIIFAINHKKQWVDSFYWMPILVLISLVNLWYMNDWKISLALLFGYLLSVLIRFDGERDKDVNDMLSHGLKHGGWHVLTATFGLLTLTLSHIV